MPAVINRHHYLPTAGVGPNESGARTGRERRGELPEPWVYVGRGTPLGNPYPRSRHTTEEALALYRRHLWERIRANDWAVMRMLRSITHDTHVICSCAPKPCHADVVVAAWRWCCERGLLGLELGEGPR